MLIKAKTFKTILIFLLLANSGLSFADSSANKKLVHLVHLRAKLDITPIHLPVNQFPLEYDVGLSYAPTWTAIKNLQIGPSAGLKLFESNYKSLSFELKSQSILIGIVSQYQIDCDKLNWLVNLNGFYFKEFFQGKFNQESEKYEESGYGLRLSMGPLLKVKSKFNFSPTVDLQYLNRTRFKYPNDKQNLSLRLGLQFMI